MKFIIAFVLVIFSMVAAEGPRPRRVLARQSAAPYQPNGYRPSGPEFNLPLRSQKQVQQPPVPAASYGPPPASEYGPPEETTETTTETIEETTTLEPQAENILDSKQKPAKLQQPGSYYVVVPQGQKYFVTPQSAPLLALPNARLVAQPRKVPIQAVPAFAKIQELPQVVEALPVLQALPSSAYTSSVYTPFSSSFVQVVQ